jgi:hypothetical protein
MAGAELVIDDLRLIHGDLIVDRFAHVALLM